MTRLVRILPWPLLGLATAMLGWRMGHKSSTGTWVRATTSRLIPRAAAKVAKKIVAFTRQRRERTLSERLGFGPNERLLIVHADDLGLARSVNAAFMAGFATGLINSGSVMVPSPWFEEIATFSNSHPEADIGLHLTLTSERADRPWACVAPPEQVPSIVDGDGCLLESWTAENLKNGREIEIELRAQIEKAYAAGLRPTHLDSHQFRLQWSSSRLLAVYLRLSREYRLPILVSREWFSEFSHIRGLLNQDDIVLDQIVVIRNDVRPENWPLFYRRKLESLPPGITAMLIHPGFDDEELRSFFGDRLSYGSAWRNRDFDFFTSEEFRELLARQRIRLITWREIASRLEYRRMASIWRRWR